MLRAAAAQDSARGLSLKRIMDTGELVPDSIIIDLVTQRVARPDCDNGFLLDGFPRTTAQANALVDARVQIDAVVEIEVEDAEVIRRMSGRRVHQPSGRSYHVEFYPPKIVDVDDVTGEPLTQHDDDKEATVRHRLSIYHRQTAPLRKYYAQLTDSTRAPKPLNITVSGAGSVEDVRDSIFFALEIGDPVLTKAK